MSTTLEAPAQSSPPQPSGGESRPVAGRRRSYVEYIRAAPAAVVSVAVHVILLGILAFMATDVRAKPSPIRIDTRLDPERQAADFNQLMDELTEATADLTQMVAVKTVSSAGGGGGSGSGGSGGGSITGGGAPKVGQNLIPQAKVSARLGMGDLPARGKLDLKVQIKGEETAVVQDQAAVVDRLAREILRMLTQKKVLVIWLFDESLSMKDDQQDIRNRFEKIYEELNLSGQAKGDALETVILSYGKDLHVQTKKPTSDFSTIREAIDNIPIDQSGEEWPCKYVIQVVRDYAKYFSQGHRTVCLVIPTDESGERAEGERKESDGMYVEKAVEDAKKIQMPIYVIGRQAVFGYPYAYLLYEDPETHDHYWPQITRGPEAPDVECLQTEGLHGRWDEQSSGFGPYELVRLARDTGGIYFMMPEPDLQVPETHFDPLDMKEYVPEYDVRRIYYQNREASPLRRAVYQVIDATRSVSVPLTFSVEPQALRQQAEAAYVTARKNRELLAKAYDYLKAVEKQRDREPSRRWRAHYDLIGGQLFAYQVKLFEYEYFLMNFVKNPPEPKYKPDAKYDVYWGVGHASHTTKTWAPDKFIAEPRERAEKLLQKVIEDHPGTPWAKRAQTELGRGFSITIGEGRHSKSSIYAQRAKLVPKY